jgi:hypothetical protein
LQAQNVFWLVVHQHGLTDGHRFGSKILNSGMVIDIQGDAVFFSLEDLVKHLAGKLVDRLS